AAQRSHPNVVAIHDVGHWERSVFVAMELVEGATLNAWLKEKPRSRAEVLGAFFSAGRGLAAAHAAGLVHRDFKPDNVLVGRDGRVRVTDFGIVQLEVREPTGTADSASVPSHPSAVGPGGAASSGSLGAIPMPGVSASPN